MINPLAVESSQNMTAVLLLIYIMDYLLVTSHHPVIHQSPGCSNQKLLFATIFVCNYYHDLYKAWSLEVKVPNCTTRSQGFVGLLLQVRQSLACCFLRPYTTHRFCYELGNIRWSGIRVDLKSSTASCGSAVLRG